MFVDLLLFIVFFYLPQIDRVIVRSRDYELGFVVETNVGNVIRMPSEGVDTLFEAYIPDLDAVIGTARDDLGTIIVEVDGEDERIVSCQGRPNNVILKTFAAIP